MNADKAWQAVLGQLQIEMPKASFDTWVRDAEFVAFEDGTFIVGVSNAYARDWLNSRLKSTTTRMIRGMMNRSVEVRFVVWKIDAPKEELIDRKEENDDHPATTPLSHNATLNPRYSFDNYIVGASNRLAHAASMAVAEQPAMAYNPLFLYGHVGLGKTHLLHAIGNACHAQGLRVLYVTSEEFTNDLIQSIRGQRTQSFRDKYRRNDVLLIDDIQFIAGKESTQEEFFHTFNALHSQNKQVVISSDRIPKGLNTLEERLRSRFGWGLIADIQRPSVEARVAILESKAEQMGREVEGDVLLAIAERMPSSIRELEGALIRTVASADLRGLPLNTDLVENSLAQLLPDPQSLDPQEVLAAVGRSFGVSVDQMLSRKRSRQIAFPRQVAMYLLREEGKLSLPQIGELLGGRDHTTIMYGYDKISEQMEKDEGLRRKVYALREQLFGQRVPYRVSSA